MSAMTYPATEESPAPTVLRTWMRGGVAHQAPSAFTSTAPAPPRVAMTVRTPRPTSSRPAAMLGSGSPAAAAASSASPSAPVSWASSSELGLSRSGAASSKWSASRRSGSSEVSTAILTPSGRSARTIWAYQSLGAPGGSDPDSTAQEAFRQAPTSMSSSASALSVLSRAPGSLSLVVVPSASVSVRFARTTCGTSTCRWGTPRSARAVRIGSCGPAGSTARTG